MTILPQPTATAGSDHSTPRLILASASPARLQLLRSAGIPADVIVSGVDESAVRADRPEALCGTLARLKAEAVATRLKAEAVATRLRHHPWPAPLAERALVLGCDSVLAFDGEVLGKPADADDAERRWRAMRGRSGVLYTGHCLVDTGTGETAPGVAATTVHFAALTDAEISTYVSTGEPLRVAGAFTIDGLGSPFIERIEGDPGTVIGLSLPLLRRLLSELGIEITSLWQVDQGDRTG
jgi:septum formation protein